MRTNNIPTIANPLGVHWEQPSRAEIQIDDQFAVMCKRVFLELQEYSASNPTGVYEGKMWKRHDGAHDTEFLAKGGKPIWLLCWYGPSGNPGYCSINSRKIVVDVF